MNKQQLDKEYIEHLENRIYTWKVLCLILAVALITMFVINEVFTEATYVYNQGFQDGQNNTCNFDNVKANMTMNSKMEIIINLQNMTDNSITEVKKLNCSLFG